MDTSAPAPPYEPGAPPLEEIPLLSADLIAEAGGSVLGHMLRRVAAAGPDDDPIANHDSYM